MKAAVVNVLGQPPRYQDFAEPKAGDGEVLIDVRAAGLHPIVKALASGSHYAGKGEVPAVPGVDGVGTLEDGSRVYFGFARKPWGTMCERTVAPAFEVSAACLTILMMFRLRRSPIPACRRGCRSRIELDCEKVKQS